MPNKRFSSTTHLHIYAIINTIIKYKFLPLKKITVRLLDVGCGDGVLLSCLAHELPKKNPGISFEFFGLDVIDSQVQKEGYFDKTIYRLQTKSPDINWKNQLTLISSKDKWPFPDDFFDLIFSNQVMEHVFDQTLLLNEIKRTMQYKGYSFHQYPLKHYIYEGHLYIPFVHKFSSYSTTYHFIRWSSFLGIGKYKWHKRQGLDADIKGYAERHADYLAFQVNYQTQKQITATAKKCGLKASFDFTYLYYKQKLRLLFRLKPIEVYHKSDMQAWKNSFYFFFLKYIEGITLILRKEDIYRSGIKEQSK